MFSKTFTIFSFDILNPLTEIATEKLETLNYATECPANSKDVSGNVCYGWQSGLSNEDIAKEYKYSVELVEIVVSHCEKGSVTDEIKKQICVYREAANTLTEIKAMYARLKEAEVISFGMQLLNSSSTKCKFRNKLYWKCLVRTLSEIWFSWCAFLNERVEVYIREIPEIFSNFLAINPLSANPIKWPHTLKQFVGKLPTNCLSVFGHFVNLALKGLIYVKTKWFFDILRFSVNLYNHTILKIKLRLRIS